MDQNTTSVDETPQMAFVNGNEAIKTVVRMLSPAAAAETASFMVDASLQLCPEAVRGHPDTPAATSLREYRFTVLMTNAASAYAEGRGQDFADDRSALDNLLQEEPEHQLLAMRFRQLMGLWLRDEHNRRQQMEFERKQKRQREQEEREMKEAQEREKAENEKQSGGEEEVAKAVEDSPSSTASEDSQSDSKDGSEVQASPTPARAKSVFDLSGLMDTDEDESSIEDEGSIEGEDSIEDEDSSSDEEEITHN